MINNFENIQTVDQPRTLRINLYRHQLASIYNMEELELTRKVKKDEDSFKETNIGILADISGFGKSASIIGLLVRDKMKWNMEEPYTFETVASMAGGRIKTYTIRKYDKINCNLVLVSSSIVHQWQQELAKCELKVGIVTSHKHADKVEPSEHDVIIITPTMFNKYVTIHKNMAWKRFIFDEPGHIRVSAMKSITAGFYWFVTATPNAIYGQHKNCKGSFMKDLICSHYWYDFETIFADIILKNDPEFVKMSFQMPPTYHLYHDCYQPLYNVINGFVSQAIHTMVEAGNIEGAILALGGGKTGNVVELVKRKKFEELEEIEAKIRIYTIRSDEVRIREWEEKRVQVENQLKEIDCRFETLLKENCSICSSEFRSPVLEPKCQNLFCGECLLKWLERNPTCPLCRSNVDPKDLVVIGSSESKLEEDIAIEKKLTKLETILDIVCSNKDGKFLIFSAYDDSFTSIIAMLNEHNISNAHIKGGIRTREINLEKYKNGEIQVIFLNASFNGSGLNLQETTDIILYHEMASNNLSQILGRANRIGREKPLNVHHLKVQT
jgi:SNF2 family DNA or RNA helicase